MSTKIFGYESKKIIDGIFQNFLNEIQENNESTQYSIETLSIEFTAYHKVFITFIKSLTLKEKIR